MATDFLAVEIYKILHVYNLRIREQLTNASTKTTDLVLTDLLITSTSNHMHDNSQVVTLEHPGRQFLDSSSCCELPSAEHPLALK